ncbi:hypothetical protein GHT06_020690 [Daphnia sinensis]|uniref:Epsilon-trimethyllysine 2-oxoglutarate dioxygenase n=1 Tax=Daphnia sinensis TaxID=1820382 RepID=A0AAD5PRR5_9CRUS|nr:hypothetical protein GHT06_020690 [Daphnia sinensis]
MIVSSLARSLFVTGRQQGISSLRVQQSKRYYEAFRLKQKNKVNILSVVPGGHQQSAKIIFDDSPSTTVNFKYIWLRDNCKCSQCVDKSTKQKLIDTPSLDVNIRPERLNVNKDGQLVVEWVEKGQSHSSIYEPEWLLRYSRCFIEDNFASPVEDEHASERPPLTLWDRTTIWKNLPEISYEEVMESDKGLALWLEMFHRFGTALLRGVPTTKGKIIDVVKRFAYVKETSYGVTFDVVAEPDPEHLAYTGTHLHHHTDMNYREKSPGMQLLHCLKSTDIKGDGSDPGGLSFLVDGFRAANWLKENEPAAFHILSATPVRFQISVNGMKFSQTWPIICTDNEGKVTEIHYNNRTMGPLQAPNHLITPFYHSYHLLTEKIRTESMQFAFHLAPGDLLAFNNRRVLHGRTAFDETRVSRHLEGCYVDIDETMAIYDFLRNKV